MVHKAWRGTEEVPYCFSMSSIKFEGHMDRKIDDFNPILSKITKLVAAIKSLRFALLMEFHLSLFVAGITRNDLQANGTGRQIETIHPFLPFFLPSFHPSSHPSIFIHPPVHPSINRSVSHSINRLIDRSIDHQYINQQMDRLFDQSVVGHVKPWYSDRSSVGDARWKKALLTFHKVDAFSCNGPWFNDPCLSDLIVCW